MPEHIVIFVTAPTQDEANTIARQLVNSKLVACANLVPGVKSLFWWDGEIDNADETLMIMKTRADLLDAVIEAVRELHSYEVPEIIALPIIGGDQDYLEWINESVS